MIDISKLDIYSEDDFRKYLNIARKTIECSWFVGALRHKSDGRWVPIIMFADGDDHKFSYAFEIRGGGAEIEALIGRLRKVSEKCDLENE